MTRVVQRCKTPTRERRFFIRNRPFPIETDSAPIELESVCQCGVAMWKVWALLMFMSLLIVAIPILTEIIRFRAKFVRGK